MNKKIKKTKKEEKVVSGKYWVMVCGFDVLRFKTKQETLDYCKEEYNDYSEIFVFEVVREFDLVEQKPVLEERKIESSDFS